MVVMAFINFVVLFLFLIVPQAYAGTVQLTTYYPSPSGNYDSLNVNNVSVATTTTTNNVTVNGLLRWGAGGNSSLLGADQGGALELGAVYGAANPTNGAVPYIDLHYGNGAAQDYNIRLINAADNRLDLLTASGGNVLTLNGSNVGVGLVNPGSKLQVNGLGGSNIDLNVNGRIHTGDANNLGGIWVDNAYTQFFGQLDANQVGIWNNGGWRFFIENNGKTHIPGNLYMGSSVNINENWAAPSGPQSLNLNSNQIWKDPASVDPTLYLQFSSNNGGVQIGGAGGATNALNVQGPATIRDTLTVNGTGSIAGLITGSGINAASGCANGWACGVTAWDMYAHGSVGAGDAGAGAAAWMSRDGQISASSNISTSGNFILQGNPVFPMLMESKITHPTCAAGLVEATTGFSFRVCLNNHTFCSNWADINGTCYDPAPGGGFSGGGSCTTPFLFTHAKGNYYIENDIMETYKNQSYDIAKNAYETNSGDNYLFRKDDYYKLSLRPDTMPDGLKFQIKELEPEESHIDHVRLLRVIADKDATVLLDQESNAVKAVLTKSVRTANACNFNNTTDCQGTLQASDKTALETNPGDGIVMQFNLNGLDTKNLFLAVDSWLLPKDKAPEKWIDDLKLFIIDPSHPEKTIRLKDLYSRVIKSRKYIFLGDALKAVTAPNFILYIHSEGRHFIDYLGLVDTTPAAFRTEELPAIKAVDTKGRDVLARLNGSDLDYAHIVRGEHVALTMALPQLKLKNGETDTYFFVTTGFYNSIRADLYPHVDATFKGVFEDLNGYVAALNELPLMSRVDFNPMTPAALPAAGLSTGLSTTARHLDGYAERLKEIPSRTK